MSIARPPEIAITLGPCDEMRAELFVRFPDVSAAGGRLVGTLVGPRRGRDTTLPTTSRLVPLPAALAAGPVSRGILTCIASRPTWRLAGSRRGGSTRLWGCGGSVFAADPSGWTVGGGCPAPS